MDQDTAFRKRSYWTPPKIKRMAGVFLAFASLGWLLSFLLVPMDKTAVLKYGDFPAFYSAAKIVSQGEGARLYDWELQKEIQAAIIKNKSGVFSPFAYPPYFAFFLWPFVWISPFAGKWILSALMLLALVVSAALTRRQTPVFRASPRVLAAFFVLFTPVSLSVLGAQNTALSMLCYAAALYALGIPAKGKGEFFCGLFLGLWLFKPQYPVFFVIFCLAAGRRTVFSGFLCVAIVYYLIGAAIAGIDWPLSWIRKVLLYSEADQYVNADHMISFSGFTDSLSRLWTAQQAISQAAGILSLFLSLVLFSWLLKKAFQIRRISWTDKLPALTDLLRLAGPAVLLLSPHTLFYDIGLCIYACAPFIEFKTDRSINLFLLLLAGIGLSTALRSWLPFQPLFFFTVGAFVFLARAIKQN